ncbi:methyltransferase, FxLD system [Streptomonospora algeriensis]|uniref:Protein-L-isoaspartate O-methyltransferase n=1 Tax=Streptomonospora algeriensis TaxID=995084 RepID=A0ABW3B9U6_9ACTN
MTDTSNRADEVDGEARAERLRHDLVTTLQDNGWVSDARVADALAAVPRHAFVPQATLGSAYAHATVSVKDDADGASLSCASVPAIVAMMLQQADLTPGQRVLEIGAGTGYNAALLARLTAPSGRVTTVDVDPDLVEKARAHLQNTGYGESVEAVCSDGADGHPAGAPFDRIMATVGAFDIPPAWLNQLAPDGRIVVPVRLAGDASRAIAFVRADDHWQGMDVQMCTFLPLRDSSASDPRRTLAVTADEGVVLQVSRDQTIESGAVHGVLDEQRSEVWTGVVFGGNESFGDLWLWLALALENSLSRMPVTRDAAEAGGVEPMLPWGSMATTARTGERGLAYLTLRPCGERHEVGVIAHGAAGPALAEAMAREITEWSEHYRNGEVGVDLYSRPLAPPQPSPGRFVLARPTAHLAVTWRH